MGSGSMGSGSLVSGSFEQGSDATLAQGPLSGNIRTGGLGFVNDDMFRLSEDDIRRESLEILAESEDMKHQMQQLLSLLGGDWTQYNSGLPSLPFPSTSDGEMQMLSLLPPWPEESTKPARTVQGRASVGWLKVKAAFRWCIFIRKMAAKRQAQRYAHLEEVEKDGEGVREGIRGGRVEEEEGGEGGRGKEWEEGGEGGREREG